MRVLLVGAGGVGTALARIAARRPFAELIVADYDLDRAQRAAAAGDGYEAVRLDARDERAAAELLTRRRCDALMNATDPRFVMPLFRAALQAGTHYLDMAMSMSRPDPQDPYRRTGVKLGDEQFALAREWEESGKLALAGIGVEPGGSDVFARYAADELFSEIDEIGVRDGANLTVVTPALRHSRGLTVAPRATRATSFGRGQRPAKSRLASAPSPGPKSNRITWGWIVAASRNASKIEAAFETSHDDPDARRAETPARTTSA